MDDSPTQVSETAAHQMQPQQASEPSSDMASLNEAQSGDDSKSDGSSPSPVQHSIYPKKPKKPIASLRKQAENAVLKQLTKAIDGHRVTARYCCGGRVLTALSLDAGKASKNKTCPISPPVVLRWDDPIENDISRRIRMPIAAVASKGISVSVSPIENLLKACNPRGTLSRSQFSVDLDPHYLGILDVVAQTLLPGCESSLLKTRPEHRGVSAQLTHLQVRSGPSEGVGMFSPAVPERDYLGKLLICLPAPHHGGQLEISNSDHSTIFDWSGSKPNEIQWAAFTGDCAHKIHPMENGYQVVLVYNLRVTERVGGVLQNPVLAESSHFPLYDGVRKMLEHPGFMKEGGKLGFYCRYPYSHTRENTANSIPYALQGVDLVIYNVFSSLGLELEVRPLLDISILDDMDELEYEGERDYYESDPLDFLEDVELSCSCCIPPFLTFEEWKAERSQGDIIGTNFHRVTFCETSEDAVFSRSQKECELEIEWKWKRYYDVKWLNTPEEREKGSPWELAMHNSANDGDISYFPEQFYSYLVILVSVPKMVERNLTVSE